MQIGGMCHVAFDWLDQNQAARQFVLIPSHPDLQLHHCDALGWLHCLSCGFQTQP